MNIKQVKYKKAERKMDNALKTLTAAQNKASKLELIYHKAFKAFLKAEETLSEDELSALIK